MKLTYMSDLHLEFGDLDASGYKGDVLILAGDITHGVKSMHMDWIAEVSERFNKTLYVMGNHEYYKGSMEKVRDKTRYALYERGVENKVHVLENETISIDGKVFHGATLWTDFDNNSQIAKWDAEFGMNDFRLIRFNDYAHRFKPDSARKMFLESIQYLHANVEEGDVVITHHAPSFQSVHRKYRTGPYAKLNPAYYSDLDDFILEKKPKFWFHGHIHHSVAYNIGYTTVLSNPRGYVGYENNRFEPMVVDYV